MWILSLLEATHCCDPYKLVAYWISVGPLLTHASAVRGLSLGPPMQKHTEPCRSSYLLSFHDVVYKLSGPSK